MSFEESLDPSRYFDLLERFVHHMRISCASMKRNISPKFTVKKQIEFTTGFAGECRAGIKSIVILENNVREWFILYIVLLFYPRDNFKTLSEG